LTRWGILVFDDKRRFAGPQGSLPIFIQTMCQTGDGYGMQIDRNPIVGYGNFNAPQDSIHRECENLYNRVAKEKRGNPEMLMFVIKGKNSIIYEHIKQFCDNVKGVQSQVLDGFKVIQKGSDRAYHANLLLKVNAKLGGTTVALQKHFTDARTPTVLFSFLVADKRYL
jgi:Piwi domain